MVDFDSNRWRALTNTQRLTFLNKAKSKANDKKTDYDFLMDMLDNYQTKLDIEIAKN